MAWTYTDDNFDILPNLYLRRRYDETNTLRMFQIYPRTGYVFHSPNGDAPAFDENGDLLYDENGNPIIQPYYTWGGATVRLDYDFATNPKGYHAVPYEDGIKVIV